MDYKILGWINAISLTIVVAPFALNFLSRKLFNSKNKDIRNIVKYLRKFHKPLGIVLIVIGIIHGYMALGSLRLHTGTLLYLSIILTGALGGSFYKAKKRIFFVWHKRMAFVSVALLMLHYFYPSAIYYLLN
ncbi:hypothetical protein E9840_10345 [Tissierella creatinini]|nr:hypothetical protein E9840_10345 [Tissierella creatinini]TJX64565.1 hypothetical protein E8P77_12000 [Soehngenia saccharolytica]